MKVSLFYLPSVGDRAAIEKGMAGLRADLYQQMLREVSEQARQVLVRPARVSEEITQ